MYRIHPPQVGMRMNHRENTSMHNPITHQGNEADVQGLGSAGGAIPPFRSDALDLNHNLLSRWLPPNQRV
jgi:hypothetical protein